MAVCSFVSSTLFCTYSRGSSISFMYNYLHTAVRTKEILDKREYTYWKFSSCVPGIFSDGAKKYHRKMLISLSVWSTHRKIVIYLLVFVEHIENCNLFVSFYGTHMKIAISLSVCVERTRKLTHRVIGYDFKCNSRCCKKLP